MGLSTSITAGMYRRSLDGRRVYSPPLARLRGVGYLVSDGDVDRVSRRVRYALALMLVVLFVLLKLLDDTLAGFALAVLAAVVFGWIAEMVVVRGLTTLRVGKSDLEPRGMRSNLLVTARAAGVPVLVALALVGMFLAVGVIWGLVIAKDWWMLLLAVPLYTFMVGMPLWQLVLLSRDERADRLSHQPDSAPGE